MGDFGMSDNIEKDAAKLAAFYDTVKIIGGEPDWRASPDIDDEEDGDDGESLDDVIDRLIETGSPRKSAQKVDMSPLSKAAKKPKVERDPVFQEMLEKRTPTMSSAISKWLKRDAKRISAILVSALFPANKADISVLGSANLRKALTQAQIDAIVDSIDLDGMRLLAGMITEGTVDVFKDAYANGAAIGGMTVDMNLVSEQTKTFAANRSAELVGMVVVDGKVVPNPNPAWSISETTREMLRSEVVKAISAGSSAQELANAIESNYAFSDTRALNIARTELSNAFNQGSIDGWKASGVKVYKRSLLSDSYDVEDECGVAARDGAIPLDKAFSNGKMAPAYHVNCKCSLSPEVQKEKAKAAAKADIGALLKANPNHDKATGQFTSATGGAGSRKSEVGAHQQTGRQKSMGEQMIAAIKTGGFTMTAKGSALMDGYSVGEFPERSLSVGKGAAFTKIMVEQWLKKNKDLLSSGKYHVGGWDDTKGKSHKYWLDIVRIYPNTQVGKAAAMRSGFKHNQVGIAHLNAIENAKKTGDWRKTVLNTHGTGEAAKADLSVLMKTVDNADKTVASRLFLFDNAATAEDIFSAMTGGGK